MKIYRGITEVLDLGFEPEGTERKELMVEHTVSFSFERSVYIKLEKGDSITHNGKLFYLKDDYIPTVNKSTNGFVYDLKFYDIMERMKDIKLKYNGETDFKLTVTGGQFLDVVVSSFLGITKGSFPTDIKEIHFENLSVFDALNLIAEAYNTEWWLNGSILNISKCEFGEPVLLRHDIELDEISVSPSSETMITRLYAKGSTRNIPRGYSQDNRLKLATGYIDLISDLPDSKIIEGVHIFEDIYPRQTTSIVEVIQGSVGDTPIFTIRGNNTFEITQNDVIAGQPLKIAFNTGNLAGREFELIIRDDNKFEIKYIQEGDLVIPNLTLKPEIGDEFFFFNFNAESVLPSLITQAENELLTAAQEYLDNLGSQLVYDCVTRSILCEENEIDLEIGQIVTIYSENIGTITSRVRGYTKELYNKFECTYQVGEYSKYSRLKELEDKAKTKPEIIENIKNEIDSAIIKATYWSIRASSPVIYKDAVNAATSGTHTTVTVIGELRSGQTTTLGGYITVTPNGETEASIAIAIPVTIAPADSDGKTSYTVRLYDTASKTTLLDTMTIPVVFKGASGVNAISAVLSNEADVLPASSEGVVSDYSGSGTDIIVYEGGTRLTYGTGNGQFQVGASGSGISVGSVSTVSGNIRRYANASNMTSDNATITFTITGKTASGASFSLTKVQAFAKSRTGQKGDTGASAPLLYLSASAQVMKCNPDNTPQTGQTISIEAKLQNVSGTATFVATPYNDAGTALTTITLGGSGNTRTLTNAQWLATYKRIEVVATLGSLNDKVTIYRVADGATGATGQNAIVGLLTNESVTLQANNAGVVSSFTPANGEFWVYNGTTRVTTGITFSKVSNTGCTATINSSGAYSVSAMTADNATAIFRAVYNGVTIEKTLSLSKSKAGADGVSITLVDVEFAKNTNPTTAPTTGWTTTAPTLAEGEQLWTRTKTVYSSGNPTYSAPANITPKKGDTGAVGQGVESVTEEFAISSSKTVQPTTGWSTTQPTWSQGQYIWSRVKVVYKNPASTVYTGYAVSSEWEAVNNLEIGSRNFWLNSEKIEDIHTNLSYSSRNLTGLIEDGAEMTIQFDIDVPVGYDFRIYKSSTSTIIWGTSSLTQVFAKNLTVGKQTIKATFNFDSTKPYIVLYKNEASYRLANVTNLMLGLGNKVTWTEAPEDVQAKINTAKQEALTAASNAQGTADSLKNFTDTAFRDGIIDRSESVAIEKYKNSLNETMSKAEASYMKVFHNTYLEGAAKTDLEHAKINLWGQRDTLLSAINTAISGGTTTPAQKTAVDNAFNTFNNLMTAFQNALEEANKAIQVKLDNISKGYVNDLEIGGRNLLLDYEHIKFSVHQGQTITYVNDGDYWDIMKIDNPSYFANIALANGITPHETSNKYIVSIFARGIGKLRIYTSSGAFVPIVDTTMSETTYNRYDIIIPTLTGLHLNTSFASLAYIAKMQLMRGNKPMDWASSPNDELISNRNLWLGTGSPITLSGGSYSLVSRDLRGLISEGDTCTLQFDITTTLAYNSWIFASQYPYISWDNMTNIYSKDVPLGKSRYKVTFNYKDISTRPYLIFYKNALTQDTATFENLTLVKGTKAVWSEAPEDVQARIDAEKTRINDILSDNIADPSEKQYLSNLWQEIYAEYPRIWAQANTYAIDKSNYESKYTALDNLLSPVLADLTVNSTVSGASIRTAFSQYYDARTFLLNNITNKVNTIAADAQAKANALDYLKQAIGQDAIMNGALFTLVTLLLKESMNADVTAGVSGIQGAQKNLPAFWAGGTYADAIAGTAGIIFRHNSTGKIGVLDVDANGNVKLMDVTDPTLIRLIFSKSNIPLVADIVSSTQFGQSVTNASSMGSTTGRTTLANGLNITKDGSTLTFSGELFVEAYLDVVNGYTSGFASVSVILYRGTSYYAELSSISIDLNEINNYLGETYNLNSELIVPSGNYTIVIERTFGNVMYQTGGISNTSTFAWSFVKDIRRFEFGLDGYMSWYTNCHSHFTENGGYDGRAPYNKWNMPGVLAAGSVTSGGGQSNVWGAKSNPIAGATPISGGFRVPLNNMGHNQYVVQITPHTNTTFRVGTKTATYFEIFGTGGFDYVVIGNNYNFPI